MIKLMQRLYLLFSVGIIVTCFTQVHAETLKDYYITDIQPVFVPVDTISFQDDPTIIVHGQIMYLFEKYPEEYSMKTFKEMLKHSVWYFVMRNDTWMIPKSQLYMEVSDLFISDFIDDSFYDYMIPILETFDLSFYKLPKDNLFFMSLENYNEYSYRSRFLFDYSGDKEEIDKLQKRDQIPPFAFSNPQNTYVRVLRPLQNKFRDSAEREKVYDKLKIYPKVKGIRLY